MKADPADEELASRRTEALGRPQFGGGRLGTYTVLGAATGIVPLPWVPDAIVRRVRGALLHDLVSRHGLALTPEARAALIAPEKEEGGGAKKWLKQGAMFAALRLVGRVTPFAIIPLAAVGPVRTALGTFVLGHLLERYLDNARLVRSARIDVDEARRVRRAIDEALLQSLATDGGSSREDRLTGEDLRDQVTQIVDGVLISCASVPGWLVRRLDAAFDEALTRHVPA